MKSTHCRTLRNSLKASNSSVWFVCALQDGLYTVHGAVDTEASLEDVWSVLVDYPGLASVFSNIKNSEVISRHPDIVLHQVYTQDVEVKFAYRTSKNVDLGLQRQTIQENVL